MHEHEQVTLQEAANQIANKDEFYDILKKRGYCLPGKKQPIVTREFLTLIWTGTLWCPKYYEIRIRYCQPNITKAQIVKEIQDLCDAKSKFYRYIDTSISMAG